jgi:hypothetical protein
MLARQSRDDQHNILLRLRWTGVGGDERCFSGLVARRHDVVPAAGGA